MLQSKNHSNTGQLSEDWLLVEKSIGGDLNAFEQLYRQNKNVVYWLCARLVGNEQTASEITQECFVKAWLSLPGYRKDASFRSWLKVIARNLCIDLSRKKNFKVWQLAESWDEHEHATNASLSSVDKIALENAVGALPEGARQILVLHDIEGYKHSEIATMCDIAEGTSKAQLARARKLMKEQLIG